MRIRLADFFDSYLVIHTSCVEPLVHQMTGVYGEMLRRQSLRILLTECSTAHFSVPARSYS